jgi:hypothetical protein
MGIKDQMRRFGENIIKAATFASLSDPVASSSNPIASEEIAQLRRNDEVDKIINELEQKIEIKDS